MVTGKSPIVPMTWSAQGQPPSDVSEEVSMVTQLDEERRSLWEVAKANLEKAHKRYKDFTDKSQREVKFQEGEEVWLNIKNFRLREGLNHKFLGPYAGPFKVLEKKNFDTYKLELPENLRVHPTFHVSLNRSPVMPQGLIESTTQGPHPTWFIMNQNLRWRSYSSQGN
jgi:hypothetical protein